jgi:hypothetical protein
MLPGPPKGCTGLEMELLSAATFMELVQKQRSCFCGKIGENYTSEGGQLRESASIQSHFTASK